MKNATLFIFACLIAFVAPVNAQTLSHTTLAEPLTASDNTVVVFSGVGITPPGTTSATRAETQMVIGKDVFRVRSVSGSYIKTVRMGSRQRHAAGETVWFGNPYDFGAQDPYGYCVVTEQMNPLVVPGTGAVWHCLNSRWVEGATANAGTAGTSVTAVENGDSSNHVTTLTFSAVTLGSPTAAANKAFGALIYTIPAGAVIVKAAYINVALTNTGGVVNADTPDLGLGTTVGSGTNALLSSVAGSENILTGQTAANTTGTATVKTVADQVLVVESAGAHTVYLNAADGWAGADTVKASGTVVLEWKFIN